MHSERMITAPDGRSLRTAVTGPEEGLAVLWNTGNPGSFLSPIDEETAEAENVRVVTYDRPGYGRSTPKPGRRVVDSPADAEAVLDAWDVEECASAGFSGGGAHALAAAALLPGRVRCVAVLSGAAPIDAEGLDFTDGLTATNAAATEHLDIDRATQLLEMEPERQRILPTRGPRWSSTRRRCLRRTATSSERIHGSKAMSRTRCEKPWWFPVKDGSTTRSPTPSHGVSTQGRSPFP